MPNDWEPALTKIDPNYLKTTKAAAEKYGIPPSCSPDCLTKSPTKIEEGEPKRSEGYCPAMPDGDQDLGFDWNTFDYLDAEIR